MVAKRGRTRVLLLGLTQTVSIRNRRKVSCHILSLGGTKSFSEITDLPQVKLVIFCGLNVEEFIAEECGVLKIVLKL